jgi:hypothetical protein
MLLGFAGALEMNRIKEKENDIFQEGISLSKSRALQLTITPDFTE